MRLHFSSGPEPLAGPAPGGEGGHLREQQRAEERAFGPAGEQRLLELGELLGRLDVLREQLRRADEAHRERRGPVLSRRRKDRARGSLGTLRPGRSLDRSRQQREPERQAGDEPRRVLDARRVALELVPRAPREPRLELGAGEPGARGLGPRHEARARPPRGAAAGEQLGEQRRHRVGLELELLEVVVDRGELRRAARLVGAGRPVRHRHEPGREGELGREQRAQAVRHRGNLDPGLLGAGERRALERLGLEAIGSEQREPGDLRAGEARGDERLGAAPLDHPRKGRARLGERAGSVRRVHLAPAAGEKRARAAGVLEQLRAVRALDEPGSRGRARRAGSPPPARPGSSAPRSRCPRTGPGGRRSGTAVSGRERSPAALYAELRGSEERGDPLEHLALAHQLDVLALEPRLLGAEAGRRRRARGGHAPVSVLGETGARSRTRAPPGAPSRSSRARCRRRRARSRPRGAGPRGGSPPYLRARP